MTDDRVGGSMIPFNRPHVTGSELTYIRDAIDYGHLSGAGPFSARCSEWLEREVGSRRAFLTPSCTAALEMAAILAEIGPGDEVIMPSFTFVTTANAVVLRGARPVFVDVRPDTLNLDEGQIDAAVTARTRALVPVHYAGVGCAIEPLLDVAARHGLVVIEDAAQGLTASYRGRPLGSFGALAAVSFHETKNVIAGEGGALLVNDERLVDRAEVVHEKGTDRRRFFRGQVDKYTWVDIGSSFPMSEINAAFLWAQLERAREITARRLEIWNAYHTAFAEAEAAERLRRPVVPPGCDHNAHMYYVLLPDAHERARFIESLRTAGVYSVFHYVPLHSAAAGRRYGRAAGDMTFTDDVSGRLARLPLWPDMTQEQVERVVAAVLAAVGTRSRAPRQVTAR